LKGLDYTLREIYELGSRISQTATPPPTNAAMTNMPINNRDEFAVQELRAQSERSKQIVRVPGADHSLRQLMET
jgi:hypothetical protein